ncbi:MAG: cation:proton antiporter [Caldisericia bacterium]|nr:cation:proton antiporter [Caldisericia bacterium]
MEIISSNIFLNIGIIGSIALAGSMLLKKYNYPAVLVYIVLGMIVSPSLLNLISPTLMSYDSIIAQIGLSFIAFSIGETFSAKNLKLVGKPGAILSILQSVFTAVIVAAGLLLLNPWFRLPIPAILILGTIAAATGPASTFMVIREYRAKGPFTNLLLAAVSIDDVVGIILFNTIIVVSGFMLGGTPVNIGFSILYPLIDIVVSVSLGLILGLLLAYACQRIHGNSSYLLFTLVMLLFATGLCLTFKLSYLLCCMALGGAMSNFSQKSSEVFSAIENFSPPIMLMFFIVSGANLDITTLPSVGWIGLATIILRSIGKIWSPQWAGKIAKIPPKISKYLGYAMLPQAGVPIGFALTVKSIFPEFDFILTIVIANVIYSQIVGPLLAKYALFQMGEATLEKA